MAHVNVVAVRAGSSRPRFVRTSTFLLALTVAAILGSSLAASADPVLDRLVTLGGGRAGALQLYGEGLIAVDGGYIGVAPAGGKTSCPNGCGIVYKVELRPNGRTWRERVIFRFNGLKQGRQPMGQLVRGTDGSLYGVTQVGGGVPGCDPDGCGVVYKLSPPADPEGNWTQTVIYRFKGGDDGREPLAGLVIDQNDVLYGTTQGGPSGLGTVFKLESRGPDKRAWGKTLLLDLNDIGLTHADAALTLGPGGELYGLVPYGQSDKGAIFMLTPPSEPTGAWAATVLHHFDGSDGENLWRARLILDADGNLYGTATYGGFLCDFLGCGVVFRLEPPTVSGDAWHYSALYQFQGGEDGRYPVGGLEMDETGALYGSVWSTSGFATGYIYKLTPSGAGPWNKTVLHLLDSSTFGTERISAPMLFDNGALYGTTGDDNRNTFGTVFRLTP